MLKKRILTATILIPMVVGFILFLPPLFFAPLSAFVFLLAYKEWPNMVGYQYRPSSNILLKSLLFSFALFFGSALISFFLAALTLKGMSLSKPIADFIPSHPFWPAFILGIWCTLPTLAVFTYPKGAKIYTNGVLGLSIGIILLCITWIALALLQKTDPKFALYPLVLVWVADTFAYFVGKKFGKMKLALKVSPGKTWEGVFGAVMGGSLLALLFYSIFPLKMPLLFWMLLNIIVVLFSVVGDLFESIFKRVHGLKDSGNLLPGHGGLLDRIDAQLTALPIFAALYFAKMIY